MISVKISKKMLVSILLAICIVFGVVKYSSKKYQESKNSEIIHILEGYAAAQKSYREAYKEYSPEKNSLGFSPDMERVITYFNKAEVPSSYFPKIPPEAIPYIEKDSFKILCLFGNKNENLKEIWTIDNSNKITHVGSMSVE